MAGFRRFTVDEYHRLIEQGFLTEDDNLELIEGYLVHKMSRNPRHDGCLHRALKCLTRVSPPGWDQRVQAAITLSESEPEPDLAIVRADPDGYTTRHPSAGDVGLVIEVADSTLPADRADKGRIYARDGIPIYWILNVVDRQVEVYSSPSGPAVTPGYAVLQDYPHGATVPLLLAGVVITTLPVAELIP